jgi:hypothetical protein
MTQDLYLRAQAVGVQVGPGNRMERSDGVLNGDNELDRAPSDGGDQSKPSHMPKGSANGGFQWQPGNHEQKRQKRQYDSRGAYGVTDPYF